jgi:hypothetical protein
LVHLFNIQEHALPTQPEVLRRMYADMDVDGVGVHLSDFKSYLAVSVNEAFFPR